jgi:DNA-binding response OmpR family regulator
MKILFGFSDVLMIDAWLDHFEGKGFEVDGVMSGEDLLAVALKFKPDIIVSEYQLKGEIDSLGVYYELLGIPKTSHAKLILLADIDEKLLNKNVVRSSGILSVISHAKLSFEAVEELL